MSATKPIVTQNRKPLQVLKKMVGKQIYVRLKSDLAYSGSLDKIDMQMNLMMSGAIEYNGDKATCNLGKIIIRGNNIIYVNLLEPISSLDFAP